MGFCIGNGNQGSHSWSLCQINIGQKFLVPFNHGISLGHCFVYAADLPRETKYSCEKHQVPMRGWAIWFLLSWALEIFRNIIINIYIRIYASTGWHYSRILIVYVIFDNTPAASLCPVHNFLDHVSGSLKLFFLLLQVILNGFTQALRPCHGCSLDHVLVAYVVWWDAGSSSFEWRFSTKMARRPDKKWITNAKEVYTAGCNPEKRCGPNYLLCGQCGLWSI